MTYREELHQAADELLDENFIKLLYKIAACRNRKETKRRKLPDTGEDRFINRIVTSMQEYSNEFKDSIESSQIKKGLEAQNEKAQNLKSHIIKKIEAIEDKHRLEMIYGFVYGIKEGEAEEAVFHGNEKKDCN